MKINEFDYIKNELSRLKKLHEDGKLSDSEFNQRCKELLDINYGTKPAEDSFLKSYGTKSICSSPISSVSSGSSNSDESSWIIVLVIISAISAIAIPLLYFYFRNIITTLKIFGVILTFFIVPLAAILGLLGFWIFGFWGALIGTVLGIIIILIINN
ncbi:MAG: hypothetical protein ACMUIU_17445 [bacterium]